MVLYEEQNLGMKCIKYLLYLSNFLFIITAMLIISVGSTIYAVYNDFNEFLQAHYFSPALFLVGIGFLILIVALFGIMGTLKESTCMIMTFSAALGVILILELLAAISAYNLPGGVQSFIGGNLEEAMKNYYTNPDDAKAVDFLQVNLNCCGINGISDWSKPPFNQSMSIPQSCGNGHVIHVDGCLRKLTNLVYQSSLMVGTGALSVALVQALGMAFACLLGKSIRRAKTERAMRRYAVRTDLLGGDHWYTQIHRADVPSKTTYAPGSSEA